MDMDIDRRLLIRRLILAFVLVVLLSLAGRYYANHRTLHIRTDAALLSFELDDQNYTIRDKTLTLSPKPGSYKYRAIATAGNKRIVLTDTVNLTTQRSADLNFNFSIYNEDVLFKAVCNADDREEGGCPPGSSIARVDFAEGYQWAVVSINSPVGAATAVLQVDNGAWRLVDGPGTDIRTGGFFPPSVERIIENEQ
jgi:hypothetical protein